MKNLILIIALPVFLYSYSHAQNIGINSTGAAPDNSAMLDINSTDKGILIPRVSIANLATAAPVTAPANSLLVYNSNTTTGVGYYFWNGTKWAKLLDSNANSDEDWHKATTSNSPTSINDDLFTNGNVGIGLNNPNELLHIKGNAPAILFNHSGGEDQDNTGIIKFMENSTVGMFMRYDGLENGTSGRVNIGSITATNTYTDFLSVTRQGDVGIGTDTPAQKLDIIAGSIQVETGFGIGRQVGHPGNEHMFYPFRLGLNALSQYGSLLPVDAGMTLESDHIIAIIETDSDALIGWFDVNQDEFIWDGKIGIGTENPGAQLTIKGDARIRLDNGINNQWDLNIDNTNGKFAIEQFTNLTTNGNRLVILTDGKIGIGENTPTHRLEVKHNVAEYAVRIFNTQDAAGNGLIIESNGGSDDDTLLFMKGDLNGTPADKFIVIGDGRVGINHSTPNALTKLDVNGYMIGQNFLFSAHSNNSVSNFSNGILSFSQVNDPYSDSYTSNNTYTAPISGFYFFSTDITFDGGDGTDDSMVLQFLKNGVSTNSLTIDPKYSSRPGNEINISNTAIIFLNTGDTVQVSITGVDTSIVDYGKRNFMGYMISK